MAVSMYMDFNNGKIEGESEDHNHLKWVEVLSFSHSFEQPTNPARSSTAGTLEKCTHNPFEITRKLDVSSVPISKACWAGKIWPMITFCAYRAGGLDGDNVNAKRIQYLTVVMEHAVIASYNISGGEGDVPEESISFNYGKITYTYIPMDKKTLDADTNNKKVHSADLMTNLMGSTPLGTIDHT